MLVERKKNNGIADLTIGPIRESDLERAITQYLNVVLTKDSVAFHIPNEGKRGLKQQYEFRVTGGAAGLPDRCILWDGKAHFLEAKTPKGRISAKQEEMFNRIAASGCSVVVVRSIEDVELALEKWGIPHKTATVFRNE